MKYAFEAGFQTSVSAEPMLEAQNIDLLASDLMPYITDSFWIGEMNHIGRFSKYSDKQIQDEVSRIRAGQTPSAIRGIYKGWTPTMKRPPKMKTPDHTRLTLGQEKYYRPFIDGYVKILQSNLKQVKHIGHNYSYTTYTCGEPHDRRNPNWKPFRLLWDYCERTGYDFYVVQDIIFERIGRKLVCECEMLRDDKNHLRMELESMFGVDFGRPGDRGLELV